MKPQLGISRGLDLDQVKTQILSHAQGFVARQDTNLFSVCADDTDLGNPNFEVPTVCFFGCDTYYSWRFLQSNQGLSGDLRLGSEALGEVADRK
jgi:hypothetical protein